MIAMVPIPKRMNVPNHESRCSKAVHFVVTFASQTWLEAGSPKLSVVVVGMPHLLAKNAHKLQSNEAAKTLTMLGLRRSAACLAGSGIICSRPTWTSATKPGGAHSLRNLHFGHCPLSALSFLQVSFIPQAACAATTAIGSAARETSSRLTHSSFLSSGNPLSCQ